MLNVFADTLNSLSPNISGCGRTLHYLVSFQVNSVTLVVPPASFVDGLKGVDGAGECRPHRVFGCQTVRLGDFEGRTVLGS